MPKFFDAALNGGGKFAGKAFFFKGQKYFQYDWGNDGGEGGPRDIKDWKFPSPFDRGLDAALEGRGDLEDKAFFFKGDRYIQVAWDTRTVDKGFPKGLDDWKIPKGFFTGKPVIDAAVNGVGPDAGYLYLFSGENWMKLDWERKGPAVLHKGLAEWMIPDDIEEELDTALSGWGPKFGNKTYFFAGTRYSRYDWGKDGNGDSCDLEDGKLAAWKMNVDPAELPTTTPLDIVLQSWNQRTGKVWVPPGASGDLPLVVYLHGNSGVKDLWGAGRMLADEASFKNDNDASNLGNFAGWLLAQGKIRPLIVAAPSDTLADLPGQKLWSSLNFPAFVKTVAETVKANYGVGVDFRQVALVGWSGGGGWPGGGVAKVAKEGARVAGKELLVLGLADGEITGTYARTISDGLSKAKNTATAIHSVSRPQGGNRFTSAQDCAQGFGLTRTLKDAQSQQKDVKKGLPLPTPAEDADRDAFAFYMDDGDPKTEPKRTVATLPVKEVWRHFGDFKKANASTDKPPRNNEHTLAPLVWSWYALPRFFPPK